MLLGWSPGDLWAWLGQAASPLIIGLIVIGAFAVVAVVFGLLVGEIRTANRPWLRGIRQGLIAAIILAIIYGVGLLAQKIIAEYFL